MRTSRPAWTVAAILLLTTLGATGPKRRALAGESLAIRAADDKLHVTVPDWSLRPGRDTDDQLRAWWHGRLGPSEVTVEVRTYPRKTYFLDAPEDVAEYSAGVYRLTERSGDERFAFVSRERLSGGYGWIPWAVLCRAPLPCIQTPRGELLLLGGILREHAYEVTVAAYPALSGPHRETVLAFLRTGVRAECPVQDPQWTAAEIKARWEQVVVDPEVRKQREPVVRSEHYIVFTNAGQGKQIARRMEDAYRKIYRALPLGEIKAARLMPVYLFRTPEQYYAFHRRVTGGTPAQSEATRGLSRQDFYATFHTSVSDPTHLREATRQILETRSRLTGGGAFLQDGLATYMSTKPGERKTWGKDVARRGGAVPLRDLIARPALGGSGEPPSEHMQAASLVEFLKDGRWKRKQFPAFILRVGLAPKNHVEALEQIVRELYGVDLAGLEANWLEYWKKR